MFMPSIIGNDLFSDSFFRDFFDDFRLPVLRSERSIVRPQMATDIKETDAGYELSIDLPGFDKNDAKIQLKDGYLSVSVEKNESKDEKDSDGSYICRERYIGKMSRSFYVGDNITEDDVKAKFESGILSIQIPKKEPEKIEEKFIAID